MTRLVQWFFQGLIVVVPVAGTAYVVAVVVRFVDRVIPISIPGLGFVIVISSITAVGFLTHSFLTQRLLDMIDSLLRRVPVISSVYLSLKDVLDAFVGTQRKFDMPVIVDLTGDGIYKPGFMTQSDLSALGLEGLVAVYMPHSYTFSGNLFLVKKDRVRPMNTKSTEALRFIVSGGVAFPTVKS
jgi:uncharacterized membrane protein